MAAEPAYVFTEWPGPLVDVGYPAWLGPLTAADAETPLRPVTAEVRAAVRDLLREGGFSPSGRNKPCSEYIRNAAENGAFPRVDVAVDIGNVAGLHGGLPTGVLDLDRLRPPLHLAVAAPGAAYVFNRSGQELALGGLLCLHDAGGPCASPVKDPMHTKTLPETRRTLTMVYGTTALPGRAAAVADWIAALHRAAGGEPRRIGLEQWAG